MGVKNNRNITKITLVLITIIMVSLIFAFLFERKNVKSNSYTLEKLNNNLIVNNKEYSNLEDVNINI